MKIIYSDILPPKDYRAIYLFGLLFVRKGETLSETGINHERIHQRQAREMLYVLFYLWYVVEWVVRLIQYKNRNEAYRNISFEREAYANDQDQGYLKRRRFWNFIYYIKIQ